MPAATQREAEGRSGLRPASERMGNDIRQSLQGLGDGAGSNPRRDPSLYGCLHHGSRGAGAASLWKDGGDRPWTRRQRSRGNVHVSANDKLYEKDQNLDVAYRLKGLLQTSGATVYMTRGGEVTGNNDDCNPDDATLSNSDRYSCANKLKAAHPGTYVLVSIHMNGSIRPLHRLHDHPLRQVAQGQGIGQLRLR